MVDSDTLKQLERGYQSQRAAVSAQNKPKVSGVKRFVSSLLPTIGGAIGAVGGSLVAPIAGTAAGGAGGSAIGEALRERITGEKTNLKDIATQGVLGAVPGVAKAVKPGFQAARAGVSTVADNLTPTARLANSVARDRTAVIANGKRVAGIADEVPATPMTPTVTVPTTPTTPAVPPPKPTLFSKMSTNLTRGGSGIKVNGNVGDINRVDQAAETFQRLGIKGTPDKQLRKITEIMGTHGKAVDNILAKNPIQLDGAAVKAQVAQAIEDPIKYAELDLSTPGAMKALNAHLDKFAGANSAKDVNDYIKVLNPIASRAQSKIARGLNLTDKESAALAAKKSGDEVLSQYPEIKPYKTDMAQLFERNPQVAKDAEKTLGIPILGIKSKTLAQGASSIKSHTGDAVASVEKAATSGTAKTIKTGGKSLFSQFATRALLEPATQDQPSSSPISQTNPEMTNDTTMIPASSSSIDPLNPDSTDNSSDIGNHIDAAIRQALAAGDTKGLNNLLAVADYYDKKRAAVATTKPLTTSAAKDIGNAQTGLDAISIIRDQLSKDPSKQIKGDAPGSGLFGGAGDRLLGTGQYDAARKQVTDVIARMRTGAAITQSEEKMYLGMLPKAFDSPDTANQKLAQLEKLFQTVADRRNTGSDISSLLSGGQ